MDLEYMMVMTTTDSEEEAEKISESLVQENLAACVQVYGAIKSTYMWEGDLTKTEEWMCFVKTKSDKFGELRKKINDIHSYENLEIIAFPIIEGGQDYMKWIDKNLE